MSTREYESSEAGKARRDRYNRSEKGKARNARYEASEHRRLRRYFGGTLPAKVLRDFVGLGLKAPA